MFKDKTFIYWLFCKPIGRQFVVNILVSINNIFATVEVLLGDIFFLIMLECQSFMKELLRIGGKFVFDILFLRIDFIRLI